MESRAHAFAAGLFTLALAVAAIAVAMWFSGNTYKTSTYVIESHYSVSGLNAQSTVRLRGVDVGKVQSIAFADSDPHTIFVRIAVRAGTPITRSTYAQLRPQGITGLSYVMLDDRGPSKQPLPPDQLEQRIPMRAGFTEELTESARGLLADARQLMGRLNAALSEENVAHLQHALSNVENATDHMARVAAALEPAAKAAPAMIAQARTTFAQAQAMMASVGALSGELRQQLAVLDRVAGSADRVGKAADTISNAVVTDALPRINVLADEIMRATENFDRLLVQLREQPSSVVFGQPRQPPAPGEPGFAPRGVGAH
jgi:phospholipid/cholesterol/gamma-HCH transport system substrate-binding protein